MLARMEETVLQMDLVLDLVLVQCVGEHGRLHELRSRSYDRQDLHWFSSNCSRGTGRTNRAGTPRTTTRGATSRVTTEAAATRQSSPSVRPGRTVALAPMRAPRSIVTPRWWRNRSLVRATKRSFVKVTSGAMKQ